MSEWWYHLWHDPMRDNPWSLLALAVIVIVFVLIVFVLIVFRLKGRDHD